MNDILLVSNVVVKESLRHRIILSLIILSFLIIMLSLILDPIALGERERLVKDAGLSTISFFSLILIILSGTRLIYQEIEKKTIFIIIPKPISRRRLLLGKFIGLLSTVSLYILASSIFFIFILFISKITFTLSVLISLLLIFLQTALLSAIAIFFSSFASPILSGMFTLITYIAGHFVNDIGFFIEKSASLIVKIAVKFIMLVIPNFYYLDVKINAVNNLPVTGEYILFSLCYVASYIVLLVYASMEIFNKREFY
ncbi:MAG: ABC transporter permease subunit [bacterium]